MRVSKHHLGLLAGAITLGIGVYFIPQFFHEPMNFTTQEVSSNPITEEEAQARLSDENPECKDICKNPEAKAFSLTLCKCCGNGVCEQERKEDIKSSESYCEKDCNT